ncbi:MAG: S-layer homology domain-containing protein [Clostridia bacterium]|nr:S-layer homology domain-containing protein [Clostridia bacterium]
MRKLRAIITLIVTVAMLVTSLGVPAFAASFSDITDQRVSEAVDKLVGFNIITGYEDGTFKPDNQITRAEFAAIVTRMKGVADNLSTDAVTGFSDLDNDTSRAWARPYVKAAVDLKIINGFEDGTFRAGEPVTYEQAVKMLVCAVGYEVVARSEYNKIIATNPNATWSAGYIAAANKHGITKGVITAKITEPAARGVVAVLTSNGLDVPEIKENEDGTFEKVDEEEEQNQNVEEIKGVVSGTYYTGLDAASVDIAQNEIMIGTGEDKQTYELSDAVKKSINFEDLIGKNVVAYYDKLDRQITSIQPRNNTSTIIKEQDVISISGDTVKYYNENGRNDSVSLSGYTKIYNGKYLANDHTIIQNLDTNFRNGQIELIEGGGQKVAKITSYQVFVVNSKSFTSTEERIYFKDGKTYNGNGYYDFPAATSSKPEIYQNGTKKEFSGSLFSEWTVVNLLESPNVGGNKINKMYITSGKKSGKITEGLDDERMVMMDGKEVYLTRDYAENPNKVTFERESTYSYVLDYTGQIAAVDKKAAASNTKYESGYIIGADDEHVRLILKDGTDKTVAMKKNVKIDGVSTDKDGVKAKLGDIAALIGNTGCYQPVKYNITGSGDSAELVALDTFAVAYTEGTPQLATAAGSNSDDTLVYYGSKNTDKASTSNVTVTGDNGDNLCQFSNSTIVIYVPYNKSSGADYSVMTASKAFEVSKTRKIEVLGVDDPTERIKSAEIVVMNAKDADDIAPAYTFTGKSPYMIVTNVRSGGKEIVGYSDGATTTTPLTISEEKFKVLTSPDVKYVSNEAVGKGDIIRYLTSGKDVIAIEMVYDANVNDSGSDKLYENKTKNYNADEETAGKIDYSYYSSYTSNVGQVHMKRTEAVKVDEASKQVSVTTVIGGTDQQIINNLLTYAISSTVVYRAESNNIVAESILDNVNTTVGSASEVIMITRSDASTPTVKAIYIVK